MAEMGRDSAVTTSSRDWAGKRINHARLTQNYEIVPCPTITEVGINASKRRLSPISDNVKSTHAGVNFISIELRIVTQRV